MSTENVKTYRHHCNFIRDSFPLHQKSQNGVLFSLKYGIVAARSLIRGGAQGFMENFEVFR